MTERTQSARRRATSLLGLTALTAAGLVAAAAPSLAASILTVSTTADIAASAGACGNSGTITVPSPLSPREATCLANNIGGAVTINVPAGTYNLANGELQPGLGSGQSVTIVGAGAGSTSPATTPTAEPHTANRRLPHLMLPNVPT